MDAELRNHLLLIEFLLLEKKIPNGVDEVLIRVHREPADVGIATEIRRIDHRIELDYFCEEFELSQ